VWPEFWPLPATLKYVCRMLARDLTPILLVMPSFRSKESCRIHGHKIRVVVKSGWITLEGKVEWNDQRERAEASVRWIRGVKGITNSIEAKPRAAPSEIRRKIEDAFRRAAEIDAGRITVETAGYDAI
jgi:osmotically-inducible protein OsmY